MMCLSKCSITVSTTESEVSTHAASVIVIIAFIITFNDYILKIT